MLPNRRYQNKKVKREKPKKGKTMTRIFNFVRSDLFLSLAGGFALGVAGLAIVNPASADIGDGQAARSISVAAPINVLVTPVG